MPNTTLTVGDATYQRGDDDRWYQLDSGGTPWAVRPHVGAILDALRAALASARPREECERCGEHEEREAPFYRCAHGVAPFPCATCGDRCERITLAEAFSMTDRPTATPDGPDA